MTNTPRTDRVVRWVFTDETFPLGNADKTPYEAVPVEDMRQLERELAVERGRVEYVQECLREAQAKLQAQRLNVNPDGRDKV